MDAHLESIVAAGCLVLALTAGWAVVSPRVRDGILVKLGLILVALGACGLGLAIAASDPEVIVLRALGLLVGGLLLAAAGMAWRSQRAGKPKRRASDWVALDTTKPVEG